MTEAEFQQVVLDVAKLRGWMPYHTLRSTGSHHGWPDLVLCRPPRLIFAELKSHDGRVSKAQTAWLTCLAQCDVETYLWKPGDLPEIVRVLSSAAVPASTTRWRAA